MTLFQSSFQLNVRRIRRAQEGEYVEADYLPVSKKDIKKMYEELLGYIRSVKNPYLQKLLSGYFVENAAFAKAFQFHSAAKTVHHGFVGGLLEHTLSVTKLCDYYAGYYPMINRDLLLTAAIFHDVGKTRNFHASRRMIIPTMDSFWAILSSVLRWWVKASALYRDSRRSWLQSLNTVFWPITGN